MTKTVKEAAWDALDFSDCTTYEEVLNVAKQRHDRLLKELEAIHQQEIAKARIHELQGVLSWNVDAKTNLKVASTITVYQRIAELSQTLKEHKEK